MADNVITLSHGNGGRRSHELISGLFVPGLGHSELAKLMDAACLSLNGANIAFTTDSHVISPIFFPGGDIGRLSVNGTANDLAVMGARPLYLSCALIIEEGFEMEKLKSIIQSISHAARDAGVEIVAGDTKVVEKGAADGIYINTSGIGVLMDHAPKGILSIQPGDAVIVSGTMGDHGAAVYAARESLLANDALQSDCACIFPLIQQAMSVCQDIRIMRDPTRGGLSSTLNEFVMDQPFGIEIDEKAVPVKASVRVICELLGFDPFHLANEGKVVLVVAQDDAQKTLEAMRSCLLGQAAAVIGRITDRYPGKVVVKTPVGGERIMDMIVEDPFPRIC